VKIREQVPLAPLTTIGVGGPARYFVEALSEGDVREAVDFSRSRELPLFVLGGGSNLVVSDQGFAGLVLKVALGGITSRPGPNRTTLFQAAAGEDWDSLVAATVRENCAGVECLSGIPGTVGGTPIQNVGAYGQEVAETIACVEALDIGDGRVREFRNAECGFSYRTSRFNTSRYIILRVSFALRRGAAPKLAYADLKKHFGSRAETASLSEIRDAVISIRRSKGMVLDPGDPDSHSAGSFFKNPILSDQQFQELQRRSATRDLRVPSYPALSAQHKVSAAWLVEQSGFRKGCARGAVGISSKHSLALINRGGATAADVLSLKTEIQRTVADQFGIELHAEPVFLGFSDASAATSF
jgi:UDP-N-acetylmuramate dehydrogenase